jgi:methionyl-tRNA formyltransferase
LKFVLAANESLGFECLKILLEENQDVVGVIIDKKYDKTLLQNLGIKKLVKAYHLDLYQPDSINDSKFYEELKKLKPDFILNVAFTQIYKSNVLNLPRIGCINYHPGPLPKYGGLNPWVWAIINNESEYGVTFHYMKEKVDAGEILGLKKFPIDDDETGLSLLLKCYKHGKDLFKEVLRNIVADCIVPIPQDLTQRTYFLNKIPYNGFINVDWCTDKIERFVRALNFSPFPNPYSPPLVKFKNTNLLITKTKDSEYNPNVQCPPGQVMNIYDDYLIMKTGDGEIKLILSNPLIPKASFSELLDQLGISEGTILGK